MSIDTSAQPVRLGRIWAAQKSARDIALLRAELLDLEEQMARQMDLLNEIEIMKLNGALATGNDPVQGSSAN